MVPDVAGISRRFDYVVPSRFEGVVEVGTIVRVDLHGRRVAAWVVEVDVVPDDSYQLKPIARVTGRGPSAEMVALAEWAAWRWAGRLRVFLRAASPPGRVAPGAVADGAGPPAAVNPGAPVPSAATRPSPSAPDSGPSAFDSVSIREGDDNESVPNRLPTPSEESVFRASRAVWRLPPAADRYSVVVAASDATPDSRDLLVLCPSVAQAQMLAGRLRRDPEIRRRVACVAHTQPGAAATAEWVQAAAGRIDRSPSEDRSATNVRAAGVIVVGARAAAFAPTANLGRVLVLDEHDESYQEESSPTWHARDVAIERGRRAGAPVLLVSPTPTLEALEWGSLHEPSRAEERRGWPVIEIVDRREEDPAAGLLTEPFAALLRQGGRVVCVVNRTGRSRLSACGSCRELLACGLCDGPVTQPDDHLVCTRCGTERPLVCSYCGATRFRVLRPGVARLKEELEALVGEAVDEVTGARDADQPLKSRVVVGTEAALHRVDRADAVAFLDIDQELMAPRERAREQTLALLARAARLVRGRQAHGRILVQTRHPDDVVLQAVVHADPARVTEADRPVRQALGLGPYMAVAEVSGPAAPAYMEALGRPAGLSIFGAAGEWRIKAADHQGLCDALAAVERPSGRLRIAVDPRRS